MLRVIHYTDIDRQLLGVLQIERLPRGIVDSRMAMLASRNASLRDHDVPSM